MGYHATMKMMKLNVTMWINFIKLSKRGKTRVYILYDFIYINIRSRQN